MPDRLTGGVKQGLVQLVLAVLALAVAGVVAGVVWEWLWTAPAGGVVDHVWVARDESNLRDAFSGTGWYVVVASLTGLLAGVLVALVLDRSPLLTLLGVTVGSVLGAYLMLRVGVALGPADPAEAARTAADGTTLPGALAVSGSSPYLAMPAGALVGLAMVFLGLAARERVTND